MAVTYSQVKELLPDCDVADAIVTSIITDATTFINSVLAGCAIMTDAEIEGIIKWYSAHMVSSGPCRQTQKERLGEAEVTYDRQNGLDMTSTSYGRMALQLDRCGKLQGVGKRAVKIHAVTSFK